MGVEVLIVSLVLTAVSFICILEIFNLIKIILEEKANKKHQDKKINTDIEEIKRPTKHNFMHTYSMKKEELSYIVSQEIDEADEISIRYIDEQQCIEIVLIYKCKNTVEKTTMNKYIKLYFKSKTSSNIIYNKLANNKVGLKAVLLEHYPKYGDIEVLIVQYESIEI